MSKFPRGFKTDCERLVAEVRDELGTPPDSPIDLDRLADHLCIPLGPLGDLVREFGLAANQDHLQEAYEKVSAFTLFERRRRRVIFNERHSHPRHRSNLSHEFAHALLGHPPEGSSGSVEQDRVHEAEAAWLGGVLLLPQPHALHVARNGVSVERAIEHFQISREMLLFRLRTTGALKRFPHYKFAA